MSKEKANAHLIAAAPQMLEALHEAWQFIHDVDLEFQAKYLSAGAEAAFAAVEKAIAKAEGRA